MEVMIYEFTYYISYYDLTEQLLQIDPSLGEQYRQTSQAKYITCSLDYDRANYTCCILLKSNGILYEPCGITE